MASLFDWVSARVGVAAFGVTLFCCVTGGQDLLVSALKSMGAFFLVRFVGKMISGLTEALEPSSTPTTNVKRSETK